MSLQRHTKKHFLWKILQDEVIEESFKFDFSENIQDQVFKSIYPRQCLGQSQIRLHRFVVTRGIYLPFDMYVILYNINVIIVMENWFHTYFTHIL